jgi:hypothetical protein
VVERVCYVRERMPLYAVLLLTVPATFVGNSPCAPWRQRRRAIVIRSGEGVVERSSFRVANARDKANVG